MKHQLPSPTEEAMAGFLLFGTPTPRWDIFMGWFGITDLKGWCPECGSVPGRPHDRLCTEKPGDNAG